MVYLPSLDPSTRDGGALSRRLEKCHGTYQYAVFLFVLCLSVGVMVLSSSSLVLPNNTDSSFYPSTFDNHAPENQRNSKLVHLNISTHERLQRALTTSEEWNKYFRRKRRDGTAWLHGKVRHIDVTRNVPRVEDFVNQTTSAPRVEREIPVDRETKENDDDDDPLNIVLFYADDWTMKVLGALNPDVKTPNIDEMARKGVLFTRNCVTTSICWISRATLMTGVYNSVHQHWLPGTENIFNKTIQWPLTLFPLLKKHNYHTGMVGKWHMPDLPEFMEYTFDFMRSYYGDHWDERDGVRRHVTDLNGQDALEFLRERPRDKHFALKVAFFATHAIDHEPLNPYQPMNESMHLYANDTIPRPKTATDDHWQSLPWFFNEGNEGRARWRNRFDTDENYQEKIKNLYRLATEVDAAVGKVINELKEQGVYNKTLLIFTTDNGNMHGEHGLAEKWYPFEESIRVPLVIQDPRMPHSQRGNRNDDFTLNVDLAPTILSAAKVPVPDFMQGRDIAPLYLNPIEAASSWRQDFFYEFNMVRRNRHEKNEITTWWLDTHLCLF